MHVKKLMKKTRLYQKQVSSHFIPLHFELSNFAGCGYAHLRLIIELAVFKQIFPYLSVCDQYSSLCTILLQQKLNLFLLIMQQFWEKQYRIESLQTTMKNGIWKQSVGTFMILKWLTIFYTCQFFGDIHLLKITNTFILYLIFVHQYQFYQFFKVFLSQFLWFAILTFNLCLVWPLKHSIS